MLVNAFSIKYLLLESVLADSLRKKDVDSSTKHRHPLIAALVSRGKDWQHCRSWSALAFTSGTIPENRRFLTRKSKLAKRSVDIVQVL